MEKETLSWSSEVWKMPLWKLDVEPWLNISSLGDMPGEVKHIHSRGRKTLNFTVYD